MFSELVPGRGGQSGRHCRRRRYQTLRRSVDRPLFFRPHRCHDSPHHRRRSHPSSGSSVVLVAANVAAGGGGIAGAPHRCRPVAAVVPHPPAAESPPFRVVPPFGTMFDFFVAALLLFALLFVCVATAAAIR